MNFLTSIKQNKTLLLSIFILSLMLLIGQWFQNEIFFNRTDIDQGQWWKVLSGNYTHSNIPHLLLNLSGVCLLGLLFIDNLSASLFTLSAVFLSTVVGLGLYFYNPELGGYYGFSGVLYGLFFVAAISAILHHDYFTGISVALLISGKVIWDYVTGGSQANADLIGIPVANDAHLYGFIGAVIIAAYLLIKHTIYKSKRHPPTFE